MNAGIVVSAITFVYLLGHFIVSRQSGRIDSDTAYDLDHSAGTRGSNRKSSARMSYQILLNAQLTEIVVTFALLFAALFIILSGQYGNDSQKWAFGTVGALIGRWLRAPSARHPE
jgi:hypothetical protein